MNGVRYLTRFQVERYDLASTLDSGQAFRWHRNGLHWEGVVQGRWVRLRQDLEEIEAEAAVDPGNWGWLRDYLQVDVSLEKILESFPSDPPMQAAVRACSGLRLLRQEPWECLASFLLSSTKQIPQIRQGVSLLCERFGEELQVPGGVARAYSFPTVVAFAEAAESELRACRIGFRAKCLKATAEILSRGEVDLEALRGMSLAPAREALTSLPGVGPKIADCVLLFAYGFARAFPVDVWVMRALKELYFKGRRPVPAAIRAFAATHFGPHAGYAQQYLFHYVRLRSGRVGTGEGWQRKG